MYEKQLAPYQKKNPTRFVKITYALLRSINLKVIAMHGTKIINDIVITYCPVHVIKESKRESFFFPVFFLQHKHLSI